MLFICEIILLVERVVQQVPLIWIDERFLFSYSLTALRSLYQTYTRNISANDSREDQREAFFYRLKTLRAVVVGGRGF